MKRSQALPILTFHALDERPDLCGFSAAVFRDGLARLHAEGWRTIGLTDLVAALRSGTAFPERTVVLTFDDGYQSVHDEAGPVLQALGMTATVFLTVGTPDERRTAERLPSLTGRAMLGWSEIHALQRAGITFGAHSLTHRDLTRLPSEQLESEVRVARTVVEERTGALAAGFSYPYGRYDARVRAVVQRHFDHACSDRFGLVGAASDPWALERIETFYLRGPRRFRVVGHAAFPAVARVLAAARALRRRFHP